MRRKRLIEVAFPLEEVSEHSAREKNVKHGHINMLHVWWARRPLAACRAFIYASLVDDPGTDREREELLKEVADLASWDTVRKPDAVVRERAQGGSGLTGRELLERARRRILACNGGVPPRLLDPFAGGGAIPLEALRLGCEAEASDLNPVAVLILKGTVEYPQQYGRPLAEQRAARDRGERDSIAGVNGDVPAYIREQTSANSITPPLPGLGEGGRGVRAVSPAAYEQNPLAADVRYWGSWMLERARERLAQFYPPDPDGSVPVAYLWSRTVPCPSCGAEMPLIRQYWLANKPNKKVALKPVVDHANKRVDFEVVEGPNVTGDPGVATTSRGDTVCLVCQQVVTAQYIQSAGQQDHLREQMTGVVLESGGSAGKKYRRALDSDVRAFASGAAALTQLADFDALTAVPTEPIARDPRNMWVFKYGFDTFGELFNDRQLTALITFAHLTQEARAEMLGRGLSADYSSAVSLYLSFALDRLANTNSTLARLMSAGARGIVGTFARQALPMVWDYAEANPLATSASWSSAIDSITMALGGATRGSDFRFAATVTKRDARETLGSAGYSFVFTDPPYYDAINYSDLSDYFYVWLKRSAGDLFPDLLSLPLTPKRPQIVMNVYGADLPTEGGVASAREQYIRGMAESFIAMRHSLGSHGLAGVVFAHTDPDAWSILIEGLLTAGLIPDASWPIDTEMANRTSGTGQARLATSVWMACRARDSAAPDAFLADVMQEMAPVIRERLLYFWSKGIRGADFFISAIGPALSVFGRHARVLRPDGSEVTVREFLDLVRRESTRVALEQVLEGADLGVVDPITRQYVTWVWSYSRAPLDAGEAIALCLATGADYREIVRDGSIAEEVKSGSKKVARLRTIRDRGRDDEGLGEPSGARPVPLIDQLQRAAYLWDTNQPGDLALYRDQLGETRWSALRSLGQAVAESLPESDDDRRLIRGLMGSSAMAPDAPRVERPSKPATLALPIEE